MSPAVARRLRLLVLAGVVIQVAVLGPPLIASLSPKSVRNDFASFYAGARTPGSELYDPRRIADDLKRYGVDERQYPLPFIRLPFYSLLLRPFGWLPYETGHAAWQLAMLAAFLLAALLSPSRGPAGRWLAAAWCLPFTLSTIRAQDAPFVTLVFVVGAGLLRTSPFLAGLVLSIGWIKWNLFWLVPLVLLVRREWSVLAGLVAGSVVWMGISVAYAGVDWPTRYVHLVFSPAVTPHPQDMPNVHALVNGNVVLEGAIVVGLALLLAYAAYRTSTDYAFTLVLIAAILSGHHGYLYDCVLLMPAFLRLHAASPSRALRMVAAVMLTPLPWLPLFLSKAQVTTQVALLVAFVWACVAGPGAPRDATSNPS